MTRGVSRTDEVNWNDNVLVFLGMKDKTIDYILRATWQAVARMYNEEASKFEGSMAIGFALLSIDKEEGTPSTFISSRMGMEATSLTRTLKTLEEKGLIIRKKNPELRQRRQRRGKCPPRDGTAVPPVILYCGSKAVIEQYSIGFENIVKRSHFLDFSQE